ncbi:MAG: preprotein translocase subunit SecG [Clostridiaceae bacterium]|jgi:preprotein translocase subunit SecG|nr:preprotein translocase subunit SecG [Clostridiaceae bacterium]
MRTARIIFIILDIVTCIALIVTVMLQDSKSKGLGVLSGDSSGGGLDTFYGKTKGRTKEGILKTMTTVLAIAFAVFTIVLYLLTGRGA